MRTQIAAVVAAVVGVVVVAAIPTVTTFAQTGLLHSARQSAANVARGVRDLSGGNPPVLTDWNVHEPVVDGFTDARGQAATLVGHNYQLVLIVGCGAGEVDNVAIGGLGGARGIGRRNRVPTPEVLFQGGGVDLRWGDGPVESQVWIDGDLILAAAGEAMTGFLDAAMNESRLRVRATTVRNRVIQDEFDLVRLEVTPDTVRMRNRKPADDPTRELSCTR